MVAALALLIGLALLAQNVSASVGKMSQRSLAAGTSHGINAAPEITDTPIPTPTCDPAWSVVSSPNTGTGHNYLNGIGVVSANDVWAVGGYYNGSTYHYQTLVEHWNGTSWSVVASPNAGTGDNRLLAVGVVSVNDVWAVGYYGGSSAYKTLVEHWDGTSWSVVASPNPVTGDNRLDGVAVVSANDVWAVGYYFNDGISAYQTLVEHWNGTSWSVVSSPNAGDSYNYLYGVSAGSVNDAWAVGFYYNGAGAYRTLIEHWDGTSWSVVSSANPGTGDNRLFAVGVVSASDVWAVGYNGQPLVEHWDGTAWSVVSSPNAGTSLSGIGVVSASDVWAVGGYYNSGSYQPLVEHWNGTAWSVVSSPNVGGGYYYGSYYNPLYGIGVVSANDVWAVGYYSGASAYQTLVEHYSPVCGTPTNTPVNSPTATGTPTVLAGDVDNNNVVDAIDYAILRATFGRFCGDPLFDARADFNRNCVVNASDFGTMKGNFARLGVPPYGPVPPSSGDAFVALQPGSAGNCSAPANGGTVQVGCRFVLDLILNSGSINNTLAQQSYLTFTSSILQNARVSSIGTSCVPTNTVTFDGTANDASLQNEVCNGPSQCVFRGVSVAAGSLAYASGGLSNCYPDGCGGVFRVAQIGLCAVAPGQAALHWQFSPSAPRNRNTDIVDISGNLVQDQRAFADYVINVVAPTNTPIPTNTPTSIHTNTPPPIAPTNTPTVTTTSFPDPNCEYQYTQSTGASIVPGTTDINCDDCITAVTLPFAVQLYGVSYNNVNVSSSGNLQFSSSSTHRDPFNDCLPQSVLNNAILPYWDEVTTHNDGGPPCAYYPGRRCGIFTSISGTAPNRVFNIEWRAITLINQLAPANFEVRLYEGMSGAGARFDFIYGQVGDGGGYALVGVQRDTGSGFTQFECDTAGSITQGLKLIFTQPPCAVTPTFVPTRTPIPPAFHFLRPGSTAGNCPAPPNGGATSVGCRFVLDLMVNAGGNVAPNGLTAQQGYMTYTYQLIQLARVSAIGTSCVPTSTVTYDDTVFDAILQNEICNGPGSCTFRGVTVGPGSFAYASGVLSNCPSGCPDPNQPPPQDQQVFRVAQVGIRAIAPGQARFHWQFLPPSNRDTEIVNVYGDIVNDPVLYTDYVINIAAPTDTPTPTPTRTPGIMGHGTWEGRRPQPDPSQMLPISLTLRLTTGGPYIDYPLQTTDASGQFTVSVAGLPNGTYNWRAKGPQFLANAGTLTLAGDPVTNLEVGLLRTGDANGDNVVNVSDFNVLKDSFGTICGGAGYDGRADFTGDCAVNILDFNLMKRNFGFSGAAPLP